MYSRDNVLDFLRKECDSLSTEISKIDNKITGILAKQGIGGINKIIKLNEQKEVINSQLFKLYEMMGRVDEIEEDN